MAAAGASAAGSARSGKSAIPVSKGKPQRIAAYALQSKALKRSGELEQLAAAKQQGTSPTLNAQTGADGSFSVEAITVFQEALRMYREHRQEDIPFARAGGTGSKRCSGAYDQETARCVKDLQGRMGAEAAGQAIIKTYSMDGKFVEGEVDRPTLISLDQLVRAIEKGDEATHQPRQRVRPRRARIGEEGPTGTSARGNQADATRATSEPLEPPPPAHSQIVFLPVDLLAPMAQAGSVPERRLPSRLRPLPQCAILHRAPRLRVALLASDQPLPARCVRDQKHAQRLRLDRTRIRRALGFEHQIKAGPA